MTTEKDVRRNKRWYRLAQFIAPLLVRKYSYKTDYTEKLDEPSIILSNHLTESDVFFVGTSFGDHLYYVCGEHLIRSKIGPFIQYAMNPISAPRGSVMIQTIAEILRRVKQGYNVAMFPEGCRSFNGETLPLPLATAKLIKKAGCALVTFRIHGGYFVAPRWAYKFRKGHVEGEKVHTYSSADIKEMTAEEIAEHINEDLYENAYEYQAKAKIRYTGKGLAEGLENYLVICPKCGSYDSMVSKGNEFHCTCCGTGGIYDEYGYLQGKDLQFNSVYDWGRWMEKRFDEDMAKNENDLIFTEKQITLYELTPEHKRIDLATGTLKIFRDRMELEADNLNKVIPFDSIKEKSLLYYGKTYLFTTHEGYFGITGPAFHAWKLYRLTTK